MANSDSANLSGVEKASVLLVTLGAQMSAETLKFLTEQEIEQLAPEMVRLRNIDPLVKDAVMTEYEQISNVMTAGAGGGRDFAVQVLEQVLGQEKAKLLVQQFANPIQGSRPFQCLWDADAAHIARLLANEQPQLIALVLANILPDKAAAVMNLLDPDLQVEVSVRIVATDQVAPSVITEVEEVIRANLVTSSKTVQAATGPEALVEILSRAERSTERLVLDALNSKDPEMGAEVRRKMFLFEDIARLPDRAIQLLLREVDQEQLRVALKGADEQIQDLVFKNMSERAAESLKEDLELLQNVRTKDIEAAQQKIGTVVRRMLVSGEIAIDEADEEAAGEEDIERSDQT
ncbi:MAG: flagellar motor switch protein FliG [Armatimonadota bacterium]|nr:flagellar motor switch protein FliG [Armatimonadota bacterium]